MVKPKPNLDQFIDQCVLGIYWAIEIQNEHWVYRYTISLVRALREKRKFNYLKLVVMDKSESATNIILPIKRRELETLDRDY